MKTIERILKSGRRVKQPAPPPAEEVQFEKCVRPYRKAEEGRVIFGDPNPDVYYRPVRHQPAPPCPPDQLTLAKIPWNQIKALAREYPANKKNERGIRFAGTHIKLELKDGSFLEGWLPDSDLREFRSRGISDGWRPARRI